MYIYSIYYEGRLEGRNKVGKKNGGAKENDTLTERKSGGKVKVE